MATGTPQSGEIVKFDDTGSKIIFGKTTIAELKEKNRQEKAANKKLPKDYKPDDHGYN